MVGRRNDDRDLERRRDRPCQTRRNRTGETGATRLGRAHWGSGVVAGRAPDRLRRRFWPVRGRPHWGASEAPRRPPEARLCAGVLTGWVEDRVPRAARLQQVG